MKWMFTYAVCACLPFTFREVSSVPYSSLPLQTWTGIAYVVVLAHLRQLYLPLLRTAASRPPQ